MKLIDKDLVDLAIQYGSQDSTPDPVVIARYICTTSPATWLLTWFDPETGQGSGYRLGLGEEDGWGLFSVLELGKWLIPTDTFFFDRVSGRTVHRQSYGRVIRDQHFTPRYRHGNARTLCGTMQRFLTWLRTMFKPKKCPKCKQNNFCIRETIKYNGHIDAQTKRIISDNVMESIIEQVVCNNCGYEPEHAEFGMSELREI